MKERWNRIKKVCRNFFFEEGDAYFPLRLSPSDKRWILFWVSVITFCMMLVFLAVVRLSERRLMNEIAAYVASATDDEYDEITWDLKYHLVYRQFGQDVEKYVQYIPNTTVDCPTCQEDSSHRHTLPVPIRGSFTLWMCLWKVGSQMIIMGKSVCPMALTR